MTSHIKSELSLLSELFLSILPYIGIPIGLAIIVACWERKKHSWNMFITGLLLSSIVWSIAFNLSSLLKIFH